MQKYTILLASILIQVCLGGVYGWTTFVEPLVDAYGLTVAQTQVIFGVSIAVFTLIMPLSGRFLERFGPRLTASISGILFAIGYLAAGVSQGSYVPLLLGVGGIGGAAIGFGYICPLTVCSKWFPRHKGLVTGLAVAGFGGGSILLTNVVGALLMRGWDALTLFSWIGILYGFAVFIGGQVLSLPPSAPCTRSSARLFPLAHIVTRPFFWVLSFGMFAGTFSGLLVIGNLSPIGMSLGFAAQTVWAVTVFAVGNGVGRIVWGWIHDRVGYGAIPACLLTQGAALALLLSSVSSPGLFVLASGLIGFGFGGCFVLFAAEAGSYYGTNAVTQVYPIIFLFYGLSGVVGPLTGGWLFDAAANYHLAVVIALVIAVVGGVVCHYAKPISLAGRTLENSTAS